MNVFLTLVKELLGPLLWLLVPLLPILAGGLLIGLGVKFGLAVVGWTGAALLAAGIVWGAVLVAMNGPISR